MAYSGAFEGLLPKPDTSGLYGANPTQAGPKKPGATNPQQPQQIAQQPQVGLPGGNIYSNPNLGQAVDLYKALSGIDMQNKNLMNMTAQDRADYEYNRALGQDKNIFDMMNQAKERFAGNYLPTQIVQSGPITMQKVPGSTGFTPLVIQGGYSQGALAERRQRQDEMMAWLEKLMGGFNLEGKGSGADFDAIRNSLLADVTKQDQLRRRGIEEQFAGMGRSLTGTAAQEALGLQGEAADRSRLAALSDVEKLRIQDAQAKNSMINAILPSILSMIMKSSPYSAYSQATA